MRKRARPAQAAADEHAAPKAKRDVPKATSSYAVAIPPKPKAAPAPTALDKRTRQKIARGSQTIDARLDLHGHTQAEAHAALLRFLRRVQAHGGRVALVITGKGGRSEETRTGALKRAVPLWFALPEFRDLVIGYDTAAISHGGEGALYVRVRKLRSASS